MKHHITPGRSLLLQIFCCSFVLLLSTSFAVAQGVGNFRIDVLRSYAQSLQSSGNPASATALQSIFPFLTAQDAAEIKALMDSGKNAEQLLLDRSARQSDLGENYSSSLMSRQTHPLFTGSLSSGVLSAQVDRGFAALRSDRPTRWVQVEMATVDDYALDGTDYSPGEQLLFGAGLLQDGPLSFSAHLQRSELDSVNPHLTSNASGWSASLGLQYNISDSVSLGLSGFVADGSFDAFSGSITQTGIMASATWLDRFGALELGAQSALIQSFHDVGDDLGLRVKLHGAYALGNRWLASVGLEQTEIIGSNPLDIRRTQNANLGVGYQASPALRINLSYDHIEIDEADSTSGASLELTTLF